MYNVGLVRADVAQLVEQRIRNAKVGGSTPLIGTIFIKHLRQPLSAGVLLCGAVYPPCTPQQSISAVLMPFGLGGGFSICTVCTLALARN